MRTAKANYMRVLFCSAFVLFFAANSLPAFAQQLNPSPPPTLAGSNTIAPRVLADLSNSLVSIQTNLTHVSTNLTGLRSEVTKLKPSFWSDLLQNLLSSYIYDALFTSNSSKTSDLARITTLGGFIFLIIRIYFFCKDRKRKPTDPRPSGWGRIFRFGLSFVLSLYLAVIIFFLINIIWFRGPSAKETSGIDTTQVERRLKTLSVTLDQAQAAIERSTRSAEQVSGMASNRLRQAIQDMAQSSQRLATLAQEVSQVRTGVSLVNSNLTVIRRAAEEAARQSFGGDTNAVAQVKREVAEMNQRHFTLTQEMAQMNARLATMDTNVTKLSAHTATRGRQLFYTFLLLAVMIPLLIFFRK